MCNGGRKPPIFKQVMTKKQLQEALKDKHSIIQSTMYKYNLTCKTTPPTANEFILLKAYCRVLLDDYDKERSEKFKLRIELDKNK